MLKKNTTINIVLRLFLFLIFSNFACAKPSATIKLALLDNPSNEMPLTLLLTDYEKSYFAGVETAAYIAKKYNIAIEYKPFIYGKGSLDILAEVPKLLTWNADLVIGPGSSDHLTLLKNYLSNIMVISSYASGQTVQMLPPNFYSTFLPDYQIMKLLAEFIHKKYPQRNIYILTQIDSKQCVDVSELFLTDYKQISPSTKIFEKKLILDDVNSIDSKKLMAGHENDVTLIFTFTVYGYNALVKHITDYYSGKDLIFFSDQDTWHNDLDNSYHKKDLAYESYRIGPILFDTTSARFKTFEQAFYTIYHTNPKDSISYMTYSSIMSAVEAINKFSTQNIDKSMREKILNSYLAALKKDPNWFRLNDYGIYRLTSQGETLVARLPKPKLDD
jgi:hypothetical protein